MFSFIQDFFSKHKEEDDFISLASHELRTPLSVVKWYTEIILDGDAGPVTEDQKRFLKQIEMSNQRAIDLVRSLLNYSRLSANSFSISPEKVNLQDVVEHVVQSLEHVREEKHLTCLFTHRGNFSSVYVDKNIASLVLRTLLVNAYTYTEKEKGVEIVLTRGREYVECSVQDSGLGIPEKEHSKVFSKMFRASNIKDDSMRGSGLGLYVVKEVLEKIGGKVTFTSKEGEGSTFTAHFPLHGIKKKKGRTSLDSGVV